MANNTIGQFIAALRKANGFTQQNVAARLNVSNMAEVQRRVYCMDYRGNSGGKCKD